MWRPTVGNVPAGSLIFVIIVAIWAAYLLQHWVRRQENTAAARSVDRFSKAMRVLERTPAVTEADAPAPHSHVGSPVRLIRPVVDVKRAAPAGDLRRSPLVARSSTDAVLDSHEVDPMPSQPHAQTSHRPAPRVPLFQRRVRAFMLLVALAWVPTSVVLVVLGRLLWVSIPFSVLTVVAVVVWLRTEATADRTRRSSRGRFEPHEEHVLSSDDTQVIRAEAVALAAMQAAHPTHPAAHPAHAVATASPAAYEEVFDVQAVRSQPVPVVQPDPAEGTWAPVPVPPPTYAMKSKAEPRLTASGIPADVFDTPEFAEEAEELDERALFARRAVSE
jgi:membrane protein implicated in regulation of membrane protease activity